MVKPFNTIITDGTMGGSGRPEDLAGEAELEFDGDAVDSEFLGAGRGSEGHLALRVAAHLHLPLDVRSLLRGGSVALHENWLQFGCISFGQHRVFMPKITLGH